jgi:hypothetical protein
MTRILRGRTERGLSKRFRRIGPFTSGNPNGRGTPGGARHMRLAGSVVLDLQPVPPPRTSDPTRVRLLGPFGL